MTIKTIKFAVLFFGAALMFLMVCGLAQADDQNEELKSEEIKAIEEQKALVQAQLDLLKVENALRDARKLETEKRVAENLAGLPTPKSTGLDGDIDVASASNQFGVILSYAALDEVAVRVASDLCGQEGLLIFANDPSTYSSAIKVAEIMERLDGLIQDLDSQIIFLDEEETLDAIDELISDQIEAQESLGAIGTALQAVPLVAGAAADITKLFRTNSKLTSIKTTISDDVFANAVFRALRTSGCSVRVFDPAKFVPAGSPLQVKLNTLREKQSMMRLKRDALFTQIEAVRIFADNASKSAKADADRLWALGQSRQSKALTDTEWVRYNSLKERETLAATRASLLAYVRTQMNERFKTSLEAAQAFNTEIYSTNSDSATLVQVVAAMDFISEQATLPEENSQPVRYVFLKIHSSEAQSIVTENMWRSDRISYSGSIIAGFEVYDENGEHVSGAWYDGTEVQTARLDENFAIPGSLID